MKSMIISAIVICSLVGCSSAPKTPPTVAQSQPVPKPSVAIPSWYSSAPNSEDTLYSVGTAASRDLQMSLDMAILNAKTNLADRLNSRIRAQTKIYSNQSSNNDTVQNSQQVERAMKNSIADVDVAGYVVAKSETQQQDGIFRTFVMLEYSRDKSADIIMDRIRQDKSPKNDVEKAFKELDELKVD